MKLDPITREAIIQATYLIDKKGKSKGADYVVFVTERSAEYPFKQLIRTAYKEATGKTITNDFFQSNPFYRNFIETTFQYRVYDENLKEVAFFNTADIKYFSLHAGEKYHGGNSHDWETGQRIKQTIFKKTKLWAESLQVNGFKADMKLEWQRRGTYEEYSWARIYRPTDKGRKIFFTVGVDAEKNAIVYKLDCYHSSALPSNILTNDQHAVFSHLVNPTPAHWQQISSSDLQDYNWDSLLEITRNFIKEYTALYDEVITAVWELPKPIPVENQSLRKQEVPNGINEIPSRKMRRFSTNPDYEGGNERKKQIGDAGENLVLLKEKMFLEAGGRKDLADKVRKMPDSHGYDIRSYQLSGSSKMIEVKTTIGSELRPFIWSITERNTMREHIGEYFLYRLYNYDREKNAADYFILEGDFTAKIMEEAINYNVYIKAEPNDVE